MDLDAFAAARSGRWLRLEELARSRRLDGEGADELIELYQEASTDLSGIRTTVGSTPVGDRLSLALSRARLRFTGVPTPPLRALTVFLGGQLPAALYRIRWSTLAVAVAFIGVAVVYGLWLQSDPRLIAALGDREFLREYAEQDFIAYYSESSEAAFSGQVWTNNAFLCALCIAFGITGLYPAYLLFVNAQGLGVSGAVMAEFDRLPEFFLYLSPHGQLELYSIFVAGAAGLLLFWAWLAPGGRSRAQALAEDGRAFLAVAVGLAGSLLVSGIIEGYVTRQDWPWPVKTGIGSVALAAFLVYQWGVGRRAWRAGETGDLDDVERGAQRIVAA